MSKKMTDVEKCIKEVKEKNGNTKVKGDSLVWYAIHKIDSLNNKLDKFSQLKLDKSTYWKTMGLMTGGGALFIALLKLIG